MSKWEALLILAPVLIAGAMFFWDSWNSRE